jgi:hypothetical protein
MAMPVLSEWLQIMLSEIARKQEEAQRAAEEEAQRTRAAQRPDPAPKYLSTQT